MKNIAIIAAVDSNMLIGKLNRMPWHINDDLKYFRETTMGHPVVMGKNTWKSIGKPLDGRINIILTHDTSFHVPGCITLNSIEQVINEYGEQVFFVIGGAQTFKQFLPFTGKIYLTRINHSFDGDTYFPEVNWEEWEISYFEQKTTVEGYQISYERWDKRIKIL